MPAQVVPMGEMAAENFPTYVRWSNPEMQQVFSSTCSQVSLSSWSSLALFSHLLHSSEGCQPHSIVRLRMRFEKLTFLSQLLNKDVYQPEDTVLKDCEPCLVCELGAYCSVWNVPQCYTWEYTCVYVLTLKYSFACLVLFCLLIKCTITSDSDLAPLFRWWLEG